MKTILVSLLLALTLQLPTYAQSGKVYKPVIKMGGSTMNLEKGKNLPEFKQALTNGGFKDITDVLKPSVKNVCIMEGAASKGPTITYEIYYLPDGRIYELVMSIDSDKDRKYPVDVTMMAQKIAFNNVCNSLSKELGSPTISAFDWEDPYTKADWDNDAKTAAALASNKLFVFFGYVSDQYSNTQYKDEASVYVTLDPLMRVRMGVKDVELFKLLKQN